MNKNNKVKVNRFFNETVRDSAIAAPALRHIQGAHKVINKPIGDGGVVRSSQAKWNIQCTLCSTQFWSVPVHTVPKHYKEPQPKKQNY